MESISRPRRFSFTKHGHSSLKQTPPLATNTYEVKALPLYTETQLMDRREICRSPTWKKESKPRGRSQSIGPSGIGIGGDGHRTSRRLVKKQPPSKRETSAHSDSSRFAGVPLISSISKGIRSRRSSMSNTNATPDGNLPALHGPRPSDEQSAIPAPRISATLPPGFGGVITRDMKQAPVSTNTAPRPLEQEREARLSAAFTANHSTVEKRHTLRRAGAPIHQPLSDEPGHRPASNVTGNAAQSDNSKDITLPESLRIGRTKKVDSGPKSPKRVRPKLVTIPPNYSLPKATAQRQEQTQTCKDCQQKVSYAAHNTKSQKTVISGISGSKLGSQDTGNAAECQNGTSEAIKNRNSISQTTTSTAADNIPAPAPSQEPDNTALEPPESASRKVSWPLRSKVGPEDKETPSQADETKDLTPKQDAKTLSMQQHSTSSRNSTANRSSTIITDSTASAADTAPKIGQEPTAPSTTETPISSARSSAAISPRPTGAAAQQDQAKETPRNTTSPKQDKFLAKIFVICCQCNFWHDIPSGLYAKMIIPEHLLFPEQQQQQQQQRPGSSERGSSAGQGGAIGTGGIRTGPRNQAGFQHQHSQRSSTSVPDNTVQCCWCAHAMAKACCTSWTTMVHLIEKHH